MRSGYLPCNVSADASLSVIQSIELPLSTPTVPVRLNGSIYAAGDVLAGGQLCSVQQSEYEKEWSVSTGKVSVSPATAPDRNKVVIVTDSSLECYNTTTGQQEWTKILHSDSEGLGGISSEPCVFDGTVYVGAGEACEYHAVDIDTGSLEWVADVDGYAGSGPAVNQGTVVVGDGAGAIYGFDTQSGRRNWRVSVNGRADLVPSIDAGTVYMPVSEDDISANPYSPARVYAIELQTGRIEWRSELEEDLWPVRSCAVDGARVYVAQPDSRITAYCTDTGSEEWSTLLGGYARDPTVTDRVVYVPISSEDIMVLDPSTGRELERVRLGDVEEYGDLATPIMLSDGLLHLFDDDGRLYMIGPDGSRPSERTDTKFYTSATTQSGDTSIYAACSNCGADLAGYDSPNFCPECGRKVDETESSDTKVYDS